MWWFSCVLSLVNYMLLKVALVVKNLPANVQFLGWEDPLEEQMATHSSILAWRIPRTEKPGGLRSIELQRVSHN